MRFTVFQLSTPIFEYMRVKIKKIYIILKEAVKNGFTYLKLIIKFNPITNYFIIWHKLEQKMYK